LDNLNWPHLPVPVDGKGMSVEALAVSGANVAYVTPSHQFPLGVTTPMSRRGELLEISTLPSGKYMKLWRDDGTVENVIKYRDFQTAWFQLIPGTNRLAIECDDLNQRGNMDVNIYYTPLYMEVQ